MSTYEEEKRLKDEAIARFVLESAKEPNITIIKVTRIATTRLKEFPHLLVQIEKAKSYSGNRLIGTISTYHRAGGAESTEASSSIETSVAQISDLVSFSLEWGGIHYLMIPLTKEQFETLTSDREEQSKIPVTEGVRYQMDA